MATDEAVRKRAQQARLIEVAGTMSDRTSDVQAHLRDGNYAAAATACVQVQALAAYLRGGMDGRLFGEFLLLIITGAKLEAVEAAIRERMQ